MEIREDEYKCYGFEILPSNETISKMETEGKELMEKTKAYVSFLGVHDTGKSVLFLFAEDNACKNFMAQYGAIEKVRYVGECAIKKDAI